MWARSGALVDSLALKEPRSYLSKSGMRQDALVLHRHQHGVGHALALGDLQELRARPTCGIRMVVPPMPIVASTATSVVLE